MRERERERHWERDGSEFIRSDVEIDFGGCSCSDEREMSFLFSLRKQQANKWERDREVVMFCHHQWVPCFSKYLLHCHSSLLLKN